MAPLPVISNVFRVAFDWFGPSGQRAENVMHFHGTDALPSDVNTALNAHVTNAMWGTVSSSCSINTITITPLDGSSASVTIPQTSTHWNGSATGEPTPNVAPVISFATAKRGRSYRGRLYLPFTGEDTIADGQLTSTHSTDLITAWSAFLVAMTAAGIAPSIASYKLATAEQITSANVLNAVGTQRRRQSRIRYP